MSESFLNTGRAIAIVESSDNPLQLKDEETTRLLTDSFGRLRVRSEDIQGVPVLGPATKENSLSVSLATDQPTIKLDKVHKTGEIVTFANNVLCGQTFISDPYFIKGKTTLALQVTVNSSVPVKGKVFLQASNSLTLENVKWGTLAGTLKEIDTYLHTKTLLTLPMTLIYRWIRAIWVPLGKSTQEIDLIADNNHSLAGTRLTFFSGDSTQDFPYGNVINSNGQELNLYLIVNGIGNPVDPILPYTTLDLSVNAPAATIATAVKGKLTKVVTGGLNSTDGGNTFTSFVLPDITTAESTLIHYFGVGFDVGTKKVIMNNQGAAWVSTNNGTSWTQMVNSSIPNGVCKIRALGGLFVALNNSNIIYTSPDGVLWTPRATNTYYPIIDVAFDSTNTIYCAITQTEYLTSSSLTSPYWSLYTFESNLQNKSWIGLEYANGVWIGINNGPYVIKCTSTPTAINKFTLSYTEFDYNWHTLATIPSATSINFIAFDSLGHFMITQNGGDNWYEGILTRNVISLVPNCCVYDGSNLVIVSPGRIFKSSNGISWNIQQIPYLPGMGNVKACVSNVSGDTATLTIFSDLYSKDFDNFDISISDSKLILTSKGYGARLMNSSNSNITSIALCPTSECTVSIKGFLV